MSSAVADAPVEFDPGSFRDRGSRVFLRDGRVCRGLSGEALAAWRTVSASRFLTKRIDEGSVVATWDAPPLDGWEAVVEHARIPLIAYPYEWSFSMLRDAALLHLSLMREALAENVILKDASAYNMQFRGCRPVFIDIPSFVPYRDGELWHGYRQFCQMFLYPLLLESYRGLACQSWLRGRLDGITPQQCRAALSFRDCFRRGVFSHVILHARLADRFNDRADGIPAAAQRSGFQKALIEHNLRRLQTLIEGLKRPALPSDWLDYDAASEPVRLDGEAKERFVRSALAGTQCEQIWDLGCNLGRYSRIAAEHADVVVAVDSDSATIDRLYRELQDEGRGGILPLVMNLADPSPGQGWRGRERQRLEDRGRPQVVLCLALLHHLVLRDNIRLADLVDWLATLGPRLIVEFVEKSDPQARSLVSNREDQYPDYSREEFERLVEVRYTVARCERLPSGGRLLYDLVRRDAGMPQP